MMVEGRFEVGTIGESEGMHYRALAWSFEKVMVRVMGWISSGSKILNLLKVSDT